MSSTSLAPSWPAARLRAVTLPAAIATAAALAGALALLLAPMPSVAAAAGCADVEVHNVRAKQGFLMVAAFVDAESFARKSVVELRLAAGGADMTFQLCGLPEAAKEVSLTLFQDLDSDGKMGRNLLGVPTEPWGASGSPGAFGPTWDNSRVSLTTQPIVVRMSQ